MERDGAVMLSGMGSLAPRYSRPSVLAALPLFFFVHLFGCASARYERAWREHARPAASHPFEGRWEGSWRSEWNGHDGGLRCIVTRTENNAFLAWFDSTYGIFSFRHKAVFTLGAPSAAWIRFGGEEDLGVFGGVYRYDGIIAGEAFEAIYIAENGDHGVFVMRRVTGEGSS